MMDRRSFLKFLGIGTAAAVAAPQVLAKKPKYTMGADTASGADHIAVAGIKDGAVRRVEIFPRAGTYKYVRVAPNTLPFHATAFVKYKDNKRGECIAYRYIKPGKFNRDEGYGVAINNAKSGNYTFILVTELAVSHYRHKLAENNNG